MHKNKGCINDRSALTQFDLLSENAMFSLAPCCSTGSIQLNSMKLRKQKLNYLDLTRNCSYTHIFIHGFIMDFLKWSKMGIVMRKKAIFGMESFVHLQALISSIVPILVRCSIYLEYIDK